MKILIPNASSATNIGDQAILLGLLQTIRRVWPEASVTIHATKPSSYKGIVDEPVRETLYSWSVFENRNVFYRLFRCGQLGLSYLLYKWGIVTVPIQGELRKILDDYRLSDLVLFTGGGFFRSKAGITQALNLGMHLLMLKFAKLWGSRVIIAPVSFGPFAYRWEEQWTAKIISECAETTFIRESISFERLSSYTVRGVTLSHDLAFLLTTPTRPRISSSELVVGFTLRKWLSEKEQTHFENEAITALIDTAVKYKIKIMPIVQVDSLEFGDTDLLIAQRASNELKAAGVVVLDIETPRTAEEAMQVYSKIDILLGMRMHSNILAANVGTPFIPISYEYKTQGIAAQLGLLELCINSETDSGREVSNALGKMIGHREQYTDLINKKVQEIKENLTRQFDCILLEAATFKPQVHVTLGVAAYNAAENIQHILEALTKQQTRNFILDKILVHVDGSGDTTASIANQFKTRGVEVIETNPRKGFANAFIKLLHTSTSDITILFNDDIRIEDEYLIDKLVQPFYEYTNIGLVCGHPIPLAPISFVDKAITTSHLAWDTMRMQLKQGHNSFTCDGKIMAMSNAFIKNIDIPKDLADMGNVDAYIFLECMRLKFGYKFVRDAIVKYRNPTTVKEHFGWSIRSNANQHRYKKKFGSLVKEKYDKPRLLYISSLSQQFFKNPFGALFIFIGGFYVRAKSRAYAKTFTQTWAVINTSKKLD